MNINNTLPYDYDAEIRNSFATYPNMHYKQAFLSSAIKYGVGHACTGNSQCVAGTACSTFTHKCTKITTQPVANTKPVIKRAGTTPSGQKPPEKSLTDQVLGIFGTDTTAVKKAVTGEVSKATGGTPSAGDPLGLQSMIDKAFGQADARIDRIEGIANRGIGESNQWQATIDRIWGQIEGIVSKENIPLVAVALGGIVIFFAIKK